MPKWMCRISIVILTLVVVMVIGAVGLTAAQGPDGGKPGDHHRHIPPRPFMRLFGQDTIRARLVEAIEEATGLTKEDVIAQMRDGKTFNQILGENELDPQVVIDAVTAVLTEELDQAVAEGNLTEERAAQALENLPDHLERLMDASLPEFWQRGDRVRVHLDDSLAGVLAEMAGVDMKDLLKEVLTPPSLADLAAKHGLDAAAIIAEAEQRITAEINEAVADGRLTEEVAAQALEGLHDRLTNRFDAPLRPLRSFLEGWRRSRGFHSGGV